MEFEAIDEVSENYLIGHEELIKTIYRRVSKAIMGIFICSDGSMNLRSASNSWTGCVALPFL
jgi:hypothetical protein